MAGQILLVFEHVIIRAVNSWL